VDRAAENGRVVSAVIQESSDNEPDAMPMTRASVRRDRQYRCATINRIVPLDSPSEFAMPFVFSSETSATAC